MSAEPRFVREYSNLLSEIGPLAFRDRFKYSVLVGFGLVAQVAEEPQGWPRRTLPLSPFDECLAAQSVLDRVWIIQRRPAGSPVGPVTSGRVTLGQDEDNDVVLSDPSVSGRHCAFTVPSAGPQIEDLGSLNGTTVNGVRLGPNEPTAIRDRAAVVIGRIKAQYLTRSSFYTLVAQHADLDR
ncbi:MAG: FHA domain-containing protein [Deltaproteobacteria bacterium]|nr:FHA domain-containing protein [Deltaproteobacteria bacterium]